MNKRYQCRTHQGGIFSMPARRGRPPVRCTPEHPCDRAKTIEVAGKTVTVPNGKPDFASMSNADLKAYAREHFSTIGKITSRAQMITAMEAQLIKRLDGAPPMPAKPAESVPAVRTAPNDSLSSAKAAKTRLEAVGWMVKGRAWFCESAVTAGAQDHMAEVIASRGAETLVIQWINGVLLTQDYSMESLRQSENGIPAHSLSFNPDELTDSELVRMVRGMKVTWWNTIASSKESAVVGTANVAVEHLFVGGGDTDNSKRIVKFLDHSGGGFRAFHVGALLKVG